jgi:hypothetical protein
MSTILASRNSSINGINNTVLIGTNSMAGATGLGPTFQLGAGVGNPSNPGDGIGVVAYIQTPATPLSTGIVVAAQFVPSGADYGEYFEWKDGNPNREDRRGLFVTFDGSDSSDVRIQGTSPSDSSKIVE